MEQERLAIICLCHQFKREDGIRTLSAAEFRELSALLSRCGKTPGSLFHMSAAELTSMGIAPAEVCRIFTLLDRIPVIETILGSFGSMGIHVVTSVDSAYFPALKATLGPNCPPMLCYTGGLSLCRKLAIGFVGSRDISPEDGEFAMGAVKKAVLKGFSVVSGGARGSDSVAEDTALHLGGTVVEFPAVPLLRRMRSPKVASFLEKKQLLLASPAAPGTGFSSSLAAARNRLIYAHSAATIVIRATACKGGTWSGASDAIKHNLCPVLCRNYPYEGNRKLIQAGAVSIDDTWDGAIPHSVSKSPESQESPCELPEQFSIF